MIDLESDIFNAVAIALRTAHPGVFVTGEYVDAPPSFPAVSIIEIGNHVSNRYRTAKIENAVVSTFEVNVYSNKAAGKKMEAKELANTLDTAFEAIGFTRTMRNQVANFNDATIFRIICRYEAIIDKDFWVYQTI